MVEKEVETDLPIPTVAAVFGALVVVAFLMCVVSSKCSAAKRKALSVPPAGCCSTGCCSFFAVKSWASATLISIVVFAATLGFLFTRVDGLQETTVGMIDVVLDLRNSPYDAVRDLYASIPADALDQLEDNKDQAQHLKFAVLGPGILAIVFLFLAGTCPCSSTRKGSYCCTKLFIILADLFLILALVFYAIFAGFAVVIKYAPPAIEEEINEILGLCDTVPAQVQQLVTDNQQALITLQATPGQDPGTINDLQAELNDLATLSDLIGLACNHLDNFFVEMVDLFLPGLLCVVAIAFAMFCNNTLCCAAGCCRSPPKAGLGSMAKPEVSV